MLSVDYLGITAYVICLLVAIMGASRRRDVWLPLIIGILLRFVLVVVYSVGQDFDSDGYGTLAQAFALQDFAGFLQSIPKGAYVYAWLVGLCYRIFGESEIMIRSINALMSSCIMLVTHDIVKSISGTKAAKNATVFVALFPSLLRFSCRFGSRETIFVLLIMVVVRETYGYYKTGRMRSLAYGLLCLLLACVVHTAALFLLMLFAFVLISGPVARGGRHVVARAFLLIALLVGAVIMVVNGIGAEKFYLNQGGLSIEKLNWISEGSAQGRASYLEGATSSNFLLFMLLIPVRVVFFLCAPFFWMITLPVDILASLDGIAYLYVSIIVVGNMVAILRKRHKEPYQKYLLCLALVLLCMVVGFSIGTSNYGAALRHRAKLICLFVTLCEQSLKWSVRVRGRTHEA